MPLLELAADLPIDGRKSKGDAGEGERQQRLSHTLSLSRCVYDDERRHGYSG